MSIGFVRDIGGLLIAMHPIYVEGPTGKSDVYVAHIDTGFSGQLILPRTIRQELELEYHRDIDARFANLRVEEVPTYHATVFWNNDWREVTVLETGDQPLIGMELLRDSSICFDAVERGPIEIQPLKRPAD